MNFTLSLTWKLCVSHSYNSNLYFCHRYKKFVSYSYNNKLELTEQENILFQTENILAGQVFASISIFIFLARFICHSIKIIIFSLETWNIDFFFILFLSGIYENWKCKYLFIYLFKYIYLNIYLYIHTFYHATGYFPAVFWSSASWKQLFIGFLRNSCSKNVCKLVLQKPLERFQNSVRNITFLWLSHELWIVNFLIVPEVEISFLRQKWAVGSEVFLKMLPNAIVCT